MLESFLRKVVNELLQKGHQVTIATRGKSQDIFGDSVSGTAGGGEADVRNAAETCVDRINKAAEKRHIK